MANSKISALPIATEIQGNELIPLVQGGLTKQTTASKFKNYFVSTDITAEAGVDVDLNAAIYDDTFMFKLSWTGGNGTAVYTLPDAVAHIHRKIRFISDGTFTGSAKHVDVTPAVGQNLDGSSNAYRINKDYEGITVWSDGVEWFILQKKA